MPRLLLLNPNTSASVSALLLAHGQRVAGPGVEVCVRTARFGAPYIACEASFAVAGHAVLDAWAAALAEPAGNAGTQGFDAVLIGCFGDPGLMALKECSGLPVTGLAEAAFAEAGRNGRFAIVTGGARWKPMLERLAPGLRHGERLAGIHTVAASGAELARDPLAARAILAQACNEAARRFDVDTVILGGAALAGMAEAIQPLVQVPLVDSLAAGVRQALALRAQSAQASQPALTKPRAIGFDFAWSAVAPELQALGRPPITDPD